MSDTQMPKNCLELPATVHAILSGVDLILHTGDVGELWVLDRLSELAPIVAVYGNDDSAEVARVLQYRRVIAWAGQRIVLCHAPFPDPAKVRAWRRRQRARGD
jgi:putative phosphoesterase